MVGVCVWCVCVCVWCVCVWCVCVCGVCVCVVCVCGVWCVCGVCVCVCVCVCVGGGGGIVCHTDSMGTHVGLKECSSFGILAYTYVGSDKGSSLKSCRDLAKGEWTHPPLFVRQFSIML